MAPLWGSMFEFNIWTSIFCQFLTDFVYFCKKKCADSKEIEKSLQKGSILPKTQSLIFYLKKQYMKAYFHIFLHTWVVSENTLCVCIEITVFFYPHKSSKIEKSVMLWFRDFWVKKANGNVFEPKFALSRRSYSI